MVDPVIGKSRLLVTPSVKEIAETRKKSLEERGRIEIVKTPDVHTLLFLLVWVIKCLVSLFKLLVRLIDAVHFTYEVGLVDKFPPVPLLKGYLRDAKKAAASIMEDSSSCSCSSCLPPTPSSTPPIPPSATLLLN